MTVRHDYACNLCNERMGIQAGDGVGVYFESGGKIRFKLPIDTNHHLCRNCLNAIKAELATQESLDRARYEDE